MPERSRSLSSERFYRRWGRRALMIPTYFLATIIFWTLTPLVLPVFFVLDLVGRRRFGLTRCLLMTDIYVLVESLGVIASFWVWLISAGWRREPSEAYTRRNLRIECWWGGTLFSFGKRLFRLKVDIVGQEDASRGPMILLLTHSSAVDNIYPIVFVAIPFGLNMRWVMNRWLRRDPCIDIVGSRLQMVFVNATRALGGGQATRVRTMASGIGEDGGVVIYPEGALFSPAKRQRIIDRSEQSDTEPAVLAQRLKHTLPPRSGGFVAALAGAKDADVVICSHTGLEDSGGYRALTTGALVGQELRIRFQRFERSAIPDHPEGQAAWLEQAWEEMDQWIGRQRTEG